MGLPSWVPQLSGAPYAMFPQPGTAGIKMSRKNADPLVGLPSTMQKSYAAAENKAVNMKALKFRKREKLGHFSMYVEGFVLDEISEVQQLSRNGQIPQDWADFGGWPEAKGNPPDKFWRTLVADRGKDGKNPPVYYSRACKESFIKGGYVGGAVNTTDLINYERNSVVAQFCRRIQAVVWNRALVKTKTGRLGLVGKDVEKGDLVCILYGCSVPVILRRGEKKKLDVLANEVECELKHLADTLGEQYKTYRKRTDQHTLRKQNAKREYAEWEAQKSKQWFRDQEWRKKWQRTLTNEKQTEDIHRKLAESDEKAKSAMVQLLIEVETRLAGEKSLVAEKKPTERKPGDAMRGPAEKRIPAEKKETRRPETPVNQQPVATIKSDVQEPCNVLRAHLRHLIWGTSQRLAREFSAWKKEKEAQLAAAGKRADWREPTMNWREFELFLKYSRIWRKRVSDRKARLRSDVEAEIAARQRREDSKKQNASTTPSSKKDKALSGKGNNASPASDGADVTKTPTALVLPLRVKQLSIDEAKQYGEKIKANFLDGMVEDDWYYYRFLGECYVHGIMDGEGMAYQNENSIRKTLFELR